MPPIWKWGTGSFSRYEQAQTPISQAVAASSALPMMYKPILVDGVEYVDGGLRAMPAWMWPLSREPNWCCALTRWFPRQQPGSVYSFPGTR
ncbi:MAG: patatin-like phospholipase family protein [Chloroflexi bacterium]|nr:patatin-like phospholipase family protein [Chloroflexota bacterium]